MYTYIVNTAVVWTILVTLYRMCSGIVEWWLHKGVYYLWCKWSRRWLVRPRILDVFLLLVKGFVVVVNLLVNANHCGQIPDYGNLVTFNLKGHRRSCLWKPFKYALFHCQWNNTISVSFHKYTVFSENGHRFGAECTRPGLEAKEARRRMGMH